MVEDVPFQNEVQVRRMKLPLRSLGCGHLSVLDKTCTLEVGSSWAVVRRYLSPVKAMTMDFGVESGIADSQDVLGRRKLFRSSNGCFPGACGCLVGTTSWTTPRNIRSTKCFISRLVVLTDSYDLFREDRLPVELMRPRAPGMSCPRKGQRLQEAAQKIKAALAECSRNTSSWAAIRACFSTPSLHGASCTSSCSKSPAGSRSSPIPCTSSWTRVERLNFCESTIRQMKKSVYMWVHRRGKSSKVPFMLSLV